MARRRSWDERAGPVKAKRISDTNGTGHAETDIVRTSIEMHRGLWLEWTSEAAIMGVSKRDFLTHALKDLITGVRRSRLKKQQSPQKGGKP
jgi:hypothetical protein